MYNVIKLNIYIKFQKILYTLYLMKNVRNFYNKKGWKEKHARSKRERETGWQQKTAD